MKEKTKRAIQAENTKKMLYQTAVRLFSDRGFEQTTVDDICQEAGVSKGAFYNHFPSKSAVIREAYYEVESHYVKVMNSFTEDQSALFQITTLTGEVINRVIVNPDSLQKARVLYSEEASGISSFLFGGNRMVLNYFEQLIQRGVDRGEITNHLPVKVISEAIFSYAIGVVFHMLSCQTDEERQSVYHDASTCASAICNSFRA